VECRIWPHTSLRKESSLQSAASGDAGVRLHDLPRNTTIHYDWRPQWNGITRTDDATFLTAGVLPRCRRGIGMGKCG